MKRMSLVLAAALLLSACTEDKTSKPADVSKQPAVEETVTAEEQEQAELNAQLKEDATEINFVEANGDQLEQGAKVKATGEITTVSDQGIRGGDFTLTTEEDNGNGMYNITNLNTAKIEIAKGKNVTIYGTYNGKDDMGMPSITATIVE